MKADREKQKTDFQEQEIAKHIVSLLDQNALALDDELASKLSSAREKALAKMLKPSSTTVISQNGVLKLMMLLLLCFCLTVFSMIKNISNQNDLESESGDAYLLSSDLPPEAFLNEGFGAWLSENTQH